MKNEAIAFLIINFTFVSYCYSQTSLLPLHTFDYPNVCNDSLDVTATDLEKNAVKIFFEKGRITEAVSSLKKAIYLEPRLKAAYNLLFIYNCYFVDSCEIGINYLKEGISNCPENYYFYCDLGNGYSKLKNYPKSIEMFKLAENLGMKNNQSLYYNLGNAYAQIRDFEQAIENYKKSVQIDNKHFDAWQNLILSYYDYGDNKNAILNAKKLYELSPNSEYGIFAKKVINSLKY